jgi:hypothetical protein
MLDPETLRSLRKQVASCVTGDRALLDELLEEVRPLVGTSVSYSARDQVSHACPEAFAADLKGVWRKLAACAAPNARMVIRFGSINDRPVDPGSLIRSSIYGTEWRIDTVRNAGFSSTGRRQAPYFAGNLGPAIEELDVWCRLTR